MESLLIPEMSMDTTNSPLCFDTAPGPAVPDSDLDKENVKDIMELICSSQIPKPLNMVEQKEALRIFGFNSTHVQFCKIHCTACNIHLGSAPEQQKNRCVHPLLNVLLCKTCYDFYCSGDFSKDVDGSELFCRWCGQGGNVICCSCCSYVFCFKCIRQNVGRRMLSKIKSLDNWQCFVCSPSQILKLRILCNRLYDYTVNEMKFAQAVNNKSILTRDHTTCCSTSGEKRKLDNIDLTDEPQTPQKLLKQYVNNHNNNESIYLSDEKDEVVCTPDVSTLMDFSSDNESVQNQPSTTCQNNEARTPVYLVKKNIPPPLQFLSLPNSTLEQSSRMPSLSPLTSTTRRPMYVALNTQGNRLNLVDKNDWFLNVKKEVIGYFNKLSIELNGLMKTKLEANSVAAMTSVHNNLQEILSTCINNIYATRRNLRTNFLSDMKSKRFPTQRKYVFVHTNSANNTLNSNNVRLESLKSGSTNPLKIQTQKAKIKVKSLSQLSRVPPECILIPDDTETDNDMWKNDNGKPNVNNDVYIIDKTDNNENNKENDLIVIDEVKAQLIDEETITIEDNPKQPDEKMTAETNDNANIVKIFNPVTIKLIKNALLESKVDQLLQSNIKYNHLHINKDTFRNMASVKVLLENNYSPGSLRINPKKGYIPMTLAKYNNDDLSIEKKNIIKKSNKNISQNCVNDDQKNETARKEDDDFILINEDDGIITSSKEDVNNININTQNTANESLLITEEEKRDSNEDAKLINKNFDIAPVEILQLTSIESDHSISQSCLRQNISSNNDIKKTPTENGKQKIRKRVTFFIENDKNEEEDENKTGDENTNEEISSSINEMNIDLNNVNDIDVNNEIVKENRLQVENDAQTENQTPENNEDIEENELQEPTELTDEEMLEENRLQQENEELLNESNSSDELLQYDEDNDHELNENADIEDFLGGSIVLKNMSAINGMETILSQYGINDTNIDPDESNNIEDVDNSKNELI